jgi:hypothetical protein
MEMIPAARTALKTHTVLVFPELLNKCASCFSARESNSDGLVFVKCDLCNVCVYMYFRACKHEAVHAVCTGLPTSERKKLSYLLAKVERFFRSMRKNAPSPRHLCFCSSRAALAARLKKSGSTQLFLALSK